MDHDGPQEFWVNLSSNSLMPVVCSVYACSKGQAVIQAKFRVRICGSPFLPLFSETHLHFPIATVAHKLCLWFFQPDTLWASYWGFRALCGLPLTAGPQGGQFNPGQQPLPGTNSPPESTCLCSLYRPFWDLFSFCFLFFS